MKLGISHRLSVLILIALACFHSAPAQTDEVKTVSDAPLFRESESGVTLPVIDSGGATLFPGDRNQSTGIVDPFGLDGGRVNVRMADQIEAEKSQPNKKEIRDVPTVDDPPQEPEVFHWKAALIQSGIFLGIQHGVRLTQKKTKDELGGPFFKDWGQSVRNVRGWRDGDGTFTNYFAHPMKGAFTGRIFVN